MPSFRDRNRYLEDILAYAPRPTLPSVIRVCWTELDQSSQIYETCLRRITDDPRLERVRYLARPEGAIANLIQDESEILSLEWICHLKLSQCGASRILRDISTRRVFKAFTVASVRLPLLYVRV